VKTLEVPTADEAIAILSQHVEEGYLLHGSPRPDLMVLEPQKSTALQVDTDTGDVVPNQHVLCATEHPVPAIFYATVQGPATDASLYRATGVKGKDSEGDFQYFANEDAKGLVRTRLAHRILSFVYFGNREDFSFSLELGHWMSHSPTPITGKLAVSATCLPFNVFDLRSPDSDPDIRRYHEREIIVRNRSCNANC